MAPEQTENSAKPAEKNQQSAPRSRSDQLGVALGLLLAFGILIGLYSLVLTAPPSSLTGATAPLGCCTLTDLPATNNTAGDDAAGGDTAGTVEDTATGDSHATGDSSVTDNTTQPGDPGTPDPGAIVNH
ncbi:MAG: hypothetical protein FWC60_11790 [Firmicutes bacterium]|nr:hypothetical protein [Bacillota bacterium]